MHLKDIKKDIPEKFYSVLEQAGIDKLRPCQEKAIHAGILKNKSVLICTPTASGKTLTAEYAIIKAIENKGKAVYIVPLKSLATEKFKDFTKRYNGLIKTGISIGDVDSPEPRLGDNNLIVITAEKFDSLLRHNIQWLKYVNCVIVDEIHLLNDTDRGPTLEILITILRTLLKDIQIVGLSATIGNPKELANWLNAELVTDDWRPVELKQAVYLDGKIDYATESKHF